MITIYRSTIIVNKFFSVRTPTAPVHFMRAAGGSKNSILYDIDRR